LAGFFLQSIPTQKKLAAWMAKKCFDLEQLGVWAEKRLKLENRVCAPQA
jgi:hypothetical protein